MLNVLQNNTASHQDTFSTGRLAPLKRLGFRPITATYSSCGHAYFATSNPLVSVTLWHGSSFFLTTGSSGKAPISGSAGISIKSERSLYPKNLLLFCDLLVGKPRRTQPQTSSRIDSKAGSCTHKLVNDVGNIRTTRRLGQRWELLVVIG